MRIFPNRLMSSLGSVGVWIKRKCLGKDSVIRDLTKGDKGDISFDAKGFKFFSTKRSVNELAKDVLSTIKNDRTLSTDAFAGKFLTVVSASKCMEVRDIREIVRVHLSNSNHSVICKAAMQEFVAEATFASQGENLTFRRPNDLWEDRVFKFVKAYPRVLEQLVGDEHFIQSLSTMTFKSFLMDKIRLY